MAIYEVEAPDGSIFQIEGPDNAPQKSILAYAATEFRKRNAELAQQIPEPPKSKSVTFGEAVTDPFISMAKGVGQVAQFPGQLSRLLTGSTEPGTLEQLGKGAEEYWQERKSQGLKAREEARAQALQEASKKGIGSEALTAIGQTITDPALLVSFLSEQIPQLLPTGIVGKGVQIGVRAALANSAKEGVVKAATAEAAGVGTQVGLGAVMQGVDVGSDAYNDAYNALKKQNVPEQQARAQALEIGRRAAFEAGGVSILAQRLPGATTLEKSLLGGSSKQGFLKGAAKGALGEGVSESLEEGGGQALANLEVSGADPSRQLTQGVGTAAGLGFVGGAGLGGISGGVSNIGVAPPPSPLEQRIQETAATGDLAERARQEEDQRLADIKTAAEAKRAGITIEPTYDDEIKDFADELLASGVVATEKEALDRAKKEIDESREADAQNALEEAENAPDQLSGTEGDTTGAAASIQTGTPNVPPIDTTVGSGMGDTGAVVGKSDEGKGEQLTTLTPEKEPSQPVKNAIFYYDQFKKGELAGIRQSHTLVSDLKTALKELGVTDHKILRRYKRGTEEYTTLLGDTLLARAKELGLSTPSVTEAPITEADLSTEEQQELQDELQQELGGATTEIKTPVIESVLSTEEQQKEKKVAPLQGMGQALTIATTPPKEGTVDEKKAKKGKKGKWEEVEEAKGTVEDLRLLKESTDQIRKSLAGERVDNVDGHLDYLVDVAYETLTKTGDDPKKSLTRRTALQVLEELNLPEIVIEKTKERLLALGKKTVSGARRIIKEKILASENKLQDLNSELYKQETASNPVRNVVENIENEIGKEELKLKQYNKELRELNKAQSKEYIASHNLALLKGKPPIGTALPKDAVDNLSKGNLKAALAIIADRGSNPIVRTYARKILGSIKDTKVSIIPLSMFGEDYSDAVGMYLPKQDHIVIDPLSLNEHTLLHEATHAAIDHILDNPNHPLTKELKAIYEQLTPVIKGQYAVTSLKEFAAETVGNDEFQNLLRSTPLDKPKGLLRSLMDGVIDAIRRAFGFIGRASKTQMDKVDDVISKLIQAGPVESRNVFPNAQEVSKLEATLNADAQHMKAAERMKFGPGLDVGTGAWNDLTRSLGEGIKARSVGPTAEVLKTVINSSVKDNFTRALAYTSTAHHIKQMFGHVRSIADTVDHLLGMDGMFQTLLKKADKTLIPWTNLLVRDPAGARYLHEVIHASTIVEADPSTVEGRKKNAVMAEAWNELGKIQGAQQLYKDIIQFYSDRRDMTLSQLLTRVENSFGEHPDFSQLSPEAAAKAKKAWDDTKMRTISGIRHQFEKGGKIEPFAPLVRRGEYWIRIGKKNSPDYVFDMSETAYEHEKKLKMYRQQGVTDIDSGFGINRVFDQIQSGSKFIKEVMKLVDEANLRQDRSELMKDIYSAYLELLPEMSMRKHFLPRKGVAGYSPDAYRDFANFAYHSSRQLARMKHSTAALNSVASAKEAIKELPNREQLSIVIEALENRVSNALKPEDPNDPLARLVNGVTNISFYYYLSAPKSAINQMLSVPMMSLPEMTAQFTKTGAAKISKELLSVFGKIARTGIKWNNGAVQFSSYSEAVPKFADIFAEAEDIVRKTVQLHQREELSPRDRDNMDFFKVLEKLRSKVPADQQANFDLRRAYEELEARNAFDSTLSMDFMPSLRNASAAIAKRKSGVGGKVLSFANQMSAGLFHAMEKASRETTAMASYNLAVKEGLSHDEAIEKALDIATRALGNYGKANAQGFMQNKGFKLIGQFKRYPIEMLFYMSKSGFDMVSNFHAMQFDKTLSPEERETARAMAKAATIRFTGMLGMVALFAGVSGMPWLAAAALQGAAMFGHLDDDDEDKLLRNNKEAWFNQWLKETFNSKAIADIISYGPVSFATRTDLHSSLSLNDLFFRDVAIKQSQESASELQQYMLEMLGPSAGMLVNAGKAWDHFNNGNLARAIETLMPAGLRQPLTAARYLSEGVVTPSGKRVFEKEDIDAVDIFKQMFGYTPQQIALQTRDNIQRKGIDVEVNQQRTKLLDLRNRAVMNDDYDMEDKIMDRIDEFNDKYPMIAIQSATLAQSLKRKEKDDALADHGLVLSKKLRTYLGDRD